MIRVSRLTKTYGDLIALEDVSFEVGRGESVLLLGPNGAGKTTLLRCMMGLLDFRGEVTVNGLDVKRDGVRVRGMIGYVPQAPTLPQDYTLRQLVALHCKLHELETSPEEVLGLVGLEEYEDFKVKELSGGMRQRLALALALSHEPEVLLLDEPTANLDQEGREMFFRFFMDWRRTGKTVLVSSHRPGDALPLTDKVIVLRDGRLVYHSTTLEFLAMVKKVRIAVRVNEQDRRLANPPGGKTTIVNREWVLIDTDLGELAGLINKLSNSGLPMILYEPDMEEILNEIGGG